MHLQFSNFPSFLFRFCLLIFHLFACLLFLRLIFPSNLIQLSFQPSGHFHACFYAVLNIFETKLVSYYDLTIFQHFIFVVFFTQLCFQGEFFVSGVGTKTICLTLPICLLEKNEKYVIPLSRYLLFFTSVN